MSGQGKVQKPWLSFPVLLVNLAHPAVQQRQDKSSVKKAAVSWRQFRGQTGFSPRSQEIACMSVWVNNMEPSIKIHQSKSVSSRCKDFHWILIDESLGVSSFPILPRKTESIRARDQEQGWKSPMWRAAVLGHFARDKGELFSFFLLELQKCISDPPTKVVPPGFRGTSAAPLPLKDVTYIPYPTPVAGRRGHLQQFRTQSLHLGEIENMKTTLIIPAETFSGSDTVEESERTQNTWSLLVMVVTGLDGAGSLGRWVAPGSHTKRGLEPLQLYFPAQGVHWFW